MSEGIADSTNFYNSYDAVFYEAFEEEEKILREILPGGYNYLFTWHTIQESEHITLPAPIVSTRTQSRFPLEWAKDLKAIITRSSGYDHISEYFKESGIHIPTAYLPNYAARAVAEQALMMWLALLRNLPLQQENIKRFHRDGLTGREVCNKKITVIGVGRIGSQIVDIADGLKMRVFGVDINPKLEWERKYNLQYVSLEDGLKNADIAVCALPLTELTRGILNYDLLCQMPKSSVFINIARGEISPSQDLLRLLNEDRLAGVGLDVYDFEKELASILREGKNILGLPPRIRESVQATLALMNHPHTILTPHNAFNTEESLERKCICTSENLKAFFETGKFITPVVEL